MTAEQLVAQIKASPVLAQYFRGEDHAICPCCVKRAVEIPDQQEVEMVIRTIVECGAHADEVKAKIREVTRELQQDLDQTMEKWRKAEHRLCEMRNAV
jgi:hypothetical protein